ncbi:hypothetical protein NL676_005918 [Syzygium grande]|nr:hypothetical protein NL676_005918 [Syzygium grande]
MGGGGSTRRTRENGETLGAGGDRISRLTIGDASGGSAGREAPDNRPPPQPPKALPARRRRRQKSSPPP